MRRAPSVALTLAAVCAFVLAPTGSTAGATADAAQGQRQVERSGAARYRSVPAPPGAQGEASRAGAPTVGGDGAILSPAPAGLTNVQNEPFLAVNPTDRDHIVVGANDYRNGDGQAGIAVTTDGGDTWTDVGTFDDIGAMPSGPPQIVSAGDPGLAFARDGSEVYYNMLGFRDDAFTPSGAGGCDPDSGIYVGRSADGLSGWTTTIAAPNTATVFNDKPLMTSGPGPGPKGTIYLTYTRFNYSSATACTNDQPPSSTPIMMRSSTDGGATWSAEVDVSGPHDDSHGSHPAVSSNGTIFVAFESFTSACGMPGPYDCIVVARSTDGTNFTRSIVRDIPTGGPYASLPDATGSFRANNFPSIAVAPNGRVIVVWGEKSGGTSDIWYSTSANGAGSWSERARVNEVSAGDQFFPWITIDSEGVAWVGYLDRREDSANNRYHAYVAHAHVGTSAPPYDWGDKRVSSGSSDPSKTRNFGGDPAPNEGHFIGDYNGIAALPGGGAFVTWIDARSGLGDQDIYGDSLSVIPLNKDDNDPAWTYTSGWHLNLHPVYSSGTRHYTNAWQAYGEITLNGAGAWRYVATKGPNMGMADVYLDGTLWTRVDLYNPVTVQQVAVAERPIGPGTHTIRIQRSGFKNARSSSGGINIDALFTSPAGVTAGVYQDTHPSAWGFTGTWVRQSSPAYSGGARHWSNSRWSRANIVVKGNRVEFRATKGPDMGFLAIWMDGTLIGNANLYAPTTRHGQTILLRNLDHAFHVFRLEVAGARDSRSTSGQVNFDVCVVT